MKFYEYVKNILLKLIEEMAQNPDPFVLHPGKDFSRNRKLGFSEIMQFLLAMEAGSIRKELLKFFRCKPDTVSTSAFIQQRKKLSLHAFYHLFYQFNSFFKPRKHHGYQLLAVDGSVLTVPLEKGHEEYTYQNKEGQRSYCQMYLNALYDLCSCTYRDVIINPRKENNEREAVCQMIEQGNFPDKTILVADRGYEGYALFSLIHQKGMYYVVRAKDGKEGGIIKGYDVPKTGEYDREFSYIYTTRNNKEVREHPEIYKQVHKSNSPYFLTKENPYMQMFLRIVRIRVSEDKYVCLLTNLPKETFSMEELKKIYAMRWGIETSFRELKYTIGLTSLHSKKAEFIQQEILARMILYNFCEIITNHVIVTQKDTKYEYQINHTMAVHICCWFLQTKPDETPPDVEALIAKELLPVRPGRNYPRKLRYHSAVGFCYRAH